MDNFEKIKRPGDPSVFFKNMDPLAKIFLAVIYFVCIPLIGDIYLLLVFSIINVLYLIIAKLYKETFFVVVLILISFMFTYLVEYIIFSSSTHITTYIKLYLTILPIMSIGIILGRTTDTLSLLYSLNKIRFFKPVNFAIIITIRYISIMRHEIGKIIDGLRVRGLIIRPYHFIIRPFFTIRILLLPILLRGFLTGERMAAAAELKGFSSKIEPTKLKDYKFGKNEFLFVIINVSILFTIIIYDRVQKFLF